MSQRPTVRNLPTPATGGDAPGRWHPRRSRRFVVPSGLALGHGRFCNAWAARVVQEKSPSRAGVVRAMARSDHWRCVSTPRWAYLVEGDLQLPAQYKPFQDLGRVRRRVGTEQGLSLGVSDQHPANEDGPGLPERYQTAVWEVSSTARVMPAYQATSALAQNVCSRKTFSGGRRGPFNGGRLALTGWRRIQGGVQTQSGDQGNGFQQQWSKSSTA